MFFKKIGLATCITASVFLCGFTVSAQDTQENKYADLETTDVYVIAKSGLNIRTTASTNLPRIDAVVYGTTLKWIGYTEIEHWSSILYENEIRYVCDDWITFDKQDLKTKLSSGYDYSDYDYSEQQEQEEDYDYGYDNDSSDDSDYDYNDSDDSSGDYYGNCRITYYCGCSACNGQWAGGPTASGAYPVAGVTVANGSLPFGTKVKINGHVYTVQDRGVGGSQFDIYVDSHSEANAGGLYYTDVYIVG